MFFWNNTMEDTLITPKSWRKMNKTKINESNESCNIIY